MFDTHDRDHFLDLGVELKPSFFPALQLGQESQIQESGKLNFYYTECHHFFFLAEGDLLGQNSLGYIFMLKQEGITSSCLYKRVKIHKNIPKSCLTTTIFKYK